MGLTAKKVYAVLNRKIKKISGDVSSLGTPLFYAGSVTTADLLPVSPKLGAVYNIEQKSIYGESGTNVVWNGILWDSLGPTFDLSLLLTKENAKNLYLQKNQGSENSGKFLVVGEDGNVILSDAQDGGVKTDTTLTKSGEAADAKVVGDKITTLKKDLGNKLDKYIMTMSVNRFDKNAISIGALVPTTGEVINQDTATTYVSDYCDIATDNDSGYLSLARKSGSNWLVLSAYSFYDKNKNFISGSYSYTNPLEIPTNAVYVRFQMGNTTQINNTVANIGTELYTNEYINNSEEIVIPTKTSELVNDSGYITGEEAEGMLPPDCSGDVEKLKFENKNLKNRCIALENLNKFAWTPFDKGYITLVFDDGSADLGLSYEIAQEYGLSISCAMPPERLSLPLSGSTMTGTVKDACNAIVASGGEVLTHTTLTLNREDVTEQDFYNYFVQNKMDLENSGFVVNGIITSGRGYSDKSVTLKWARQYYLYSDSEGTGQGYPQYEKSRYLVYGNTTTNNIEQIKSRIANAVTNKTWLVLGFHTISETSVLGTSETLLRDLFSTIKGYIDNGTLRNVTYNYMYNNFGSTELEQRIIALENN